MFDLMSKDDMFNSLTTLKVKQDIIDGKITKEQGELQLRSYQQLASLMKSLPDGLTNAQKRKALGLLQEKVLLKSQIEKGDPAAYPFPTQCQGKPSTGFSFHFRY